MKAQVAPPPDATRVPTRVWRGAGWRLAGRIWSSACTLVVLYLAAQALDLASFGRLTFYLAVFAVLDAIVDSGTGQALVQRTADRPEALLATLARARRVRVIAGLAGVALVGGGAWLLEEPEAGWITLASLYPTTHALELSTIALRNELRWGPQVAIRAFAAGTGLVLTLIVLAVGTPTAGKLLVALAAGSTTGNLLAHAVGRRSLPRGPRGAADPWGPFLRVALPLGAAAICQQAYFWCDNAVLRAVHGEASVGPYNIAVRIMGWSLSVAVYASAVALPWLTRAEAGDQLLAATLRLAVPLAAAAAFAVGLVTPWSAHLVGLFGEEFASGGPALEVLLLAVIAVHAGAPLLTAVTASGRSRTVLALSALALLLNLGLNAVWVPSAGALGAARATLATETWVALASAACLARAARPRPSARLLLPWLAVPACWVAGRSLALLVHAS